MWLHDDILLTWHLTGTSMDTIWDRRELGATRVSKLERGCGLQISVWKTNAKYIAILPQSVARINNSEVYPNAMAYCNPY